MPVPLTHDGKKKDNSVSGPNGKSNTHDPLSAPSTITTTTIISESARNPTQAPTGSGPGVMTQEEVDRLYEERMEEEYAKREGGA